MSENTADSTAIPTRSRRRGKLLRVAIAIIAGLALLTAIGFGINRVLAPVNTHKTTSHARTAIMSTPRAPAGLTAIADAPAGFTTAASAYALDARNLPVEQYSPSYCSALWGVAPVTSADSHSSDEVQQLGYYQDAADASTGRSTEVLSAVARRFATHAAAQTTVDAMNALAARCSPVYKDGSADVQVATAAAALGHVMTSGWNQTIIERSADLFPGSQTSRFLVAGNVVAQVNCFDSIASAARDRVCAAWALSVESALAAPTV